MTGAGGGSTADRRPAGTGDPARPASTARQAAGDPEREVMGLLLTTNAQMVAEVLRGRGEPSSEQVMRAIAAVRSLAMIVEDTLHALVEQARAGGHTWAEIGEVLHVTRQAAFQRFGSGGGPIPGEQGVEVPVKGAAELAVAVLRAFLESRFVEARSGFDKRMVNACSIELLADVREKVRRQAGEVQEIGTPSVSVRDGYTVVDIPVALERGDGIGRVVLDADSQVAGFFVRPKDGMS